MQPTKATVASLQGCGMKVYLGSTAVRGSEMANLNGWQGACVVCASWVGQPASNAHCAMLETVSGACSGCIINAQPSHGATTSWAAPAAVAAAAAQGIIIQCRGQPAVGREGAEGIFRWEWNVGTISSAAGAMPSGGGLLMVRCHRAHRRRPPCSGRAGAMHLMPAAP